MDNCTTCKFYRQVKNLLPRYDTPRGDCIAHAPTIVDAKGFAKFPVVKPEMYCGDYCFATRHDRDEFKLSPAPPIPELSGLSA